MRSAFPGVACLAVFALCASPALWSQAIGSVIGTVTDPSGALVAGATVTATNVDTQVAKSVVTGGAGEFTLSNLPVGKYNLTANAQGFSIAHVDAVTLDVSQTRNIDFKVVPGGESQTAIVIAAPPLLNTTDPSLAGLVSEQYCAGAAWNTWPQHPHRTELVEWRLLTDQKYSID